MLDLAQKDALTTSAALIGRVRQAVAERAAYRLIDGGNPTQEQTDWANSVFVGLRRNQIAADLMPELVCDPAIADSSTGDATDVTDSALKAAVETICEKYTGVAQ